MKFYGYRRSDGKVGIRNKVLILPTCICSCETSRIVASQVKGTITINNQNGCAQVGRDLKITMNVLAGLAANPNVYGTIVIGLGCEGAIPDKVYELIESYTNKPLKKVVIQEDGGTSGAIKKAADYARKMVQEASLVNKEEFDISELIVATECGGSDSTSGLVSNPVVGQMSDLLVKYGATTILSETTEFIGAEHLLAKRGATEEIKERILEIVKNYEEHIKSVGESLRDGNPTPGNRAGGLTTIEEKSLGCIHKGGHSQINEVLDYGKEPTKKGLVIMDTPGYDVASMTGMAAGGAQIAVFTTGRGTPTGNPFMPVIKLTGNKLTYNKMECDIDMDVSSVLDGESTIEEMGEKLFEEVMAVANGKITKAEAMGFSEFASIRFCNYV